jgi:hypothetical protein
MQTESAQESDDELETFSMEHALQPSTSTQMVLFKPMLKTYKLKATTIFRTIVAGCV